MYNIEQLNNATMSNQVFDDEKIVLGMIELIPRDENDLTKDMLTNLLSISMKKNYPAAITELLKRNVNLGIDNYKILEWVTQNKRIFDIKFLIEMYPSVTVDRFVRWACQEKQTEIINLIMERYPDASDNYLIRFMSENGNVEMVQKLLLDKRVTPSTNNNYALRWACAGGFVEIVKMLLAHPLVNPKDSEKESFTWAFCNGHVEVVQLLLQDVRIDPKLEQYYNHLMAEAAARGKIDIIKLFLGYSQMKLDNIVFHNAIQNGHLDIVKILLADSRVNPNDNNYGALRTALLHEHHNIAELLIQYVNISEVKNNSIITFHKQWMEKKASQQKAAADEIFAIMQKHNINGFFHDGTKKTMIIGGDVLTF